jgi:hypothetical protein
MSHHPRHSAQENILEKIERTPITLIKTFVYFRKIARTQVKKLRKKIF